LLYALPEAEFSDFTMGDFSLRIVPGGHFFLNSPDGRLLREVEGTLLPWCGWRARWRRIPCLLEVPVSR
jgi:hypothetical protein